MCEYIPFLNARYKVNIFVFTLFTFKFADLAEIIWVKIVQKFSVSLRSSFEKWLVSFHDKTKHDNNSITGGYYAHPIFEIWSTPDF